MDNTYFLSQSSSLTLVVIISLIFAVLGIYHSKKFQGISNYLILDIFLNDKGLRQQILSL